MPDSRPPLGLTPRDPKRKTQNTRQRHSLEELPGATKEDSRVAPGHSRVMGRSPGTQTDAGAEGRTSHWSALAQPCMVCL